MGITRVMFAALDHANMIITHWDLDITCAMFAVLNHANMILMYHDLDMKFIIYSALNHANVLLICPKRFIELEGLYGLNHIHE